MDLATPEQRVRDRIAAAGPLAAYRELIAENDALIRSRDLDMGRRIVTERTAIYTELARHWVETNHQASGYDAPFALVALGGTGRAEMAPRSDLDFGFLLEDDAAGNPFAARLHEQLVSGEFARTYGFAGRLQPFCPEYLRVFDQPQVNSFLDLRAVYDPYGLTERYRERLRATVDRFRHFLHVRQFWNEHWEKVAGECERLDQFDIKHAAARVFLAGVWTLAGEEFVHSHEIYRTQVPERDLAAFDFVLRVRSYAHLQRPLVAPRGGGFHGEDQLTFEDFRNLGDWIGPGATERERLEFGNEVRARLLAARRRIACFARCVFARVLEQGRRVRPDSPVVFGLGGLRHDPPPPAATPEQRSAAALRLLWWHARHEVPVDPSELQATFRDAGDWLTRVPELSALFYELEGSLADAMDYLAQIDGAQARLFPGYVQFEASLDGRVMEEKTWLRGVLERRKLRALEGYLREGRKELQAAITPEQLAKLTDVTDRVRVEIEVAQLDAEAIAAVRLALHTKRLPVTADDLAMRDDSRRDLHERFASGLSGVSLEAYYQPFIEQAGFAPETVRLTEFLIRHRRAFADRAQGRLLDEKEVAAFADLCGSPARLRALFAFTCADRSEWHGATTEPTRWFNISDLYQKSVLHFQGRREYTRAIETGGYAPDEVRIIMDFGSTLFGGCYRQYVNRFGAQLLRLADPQDSGMPKALELRIGAGVIVGVAARDYEGLAATIAGTFFEHGIKLSQAHLFSATNAHLALDFFHVAGSGPSFPPDFLKIIEAAIRDRRHIAAEDEARLPRIEGTWTLELWRSGIYRLEFRSARDTPGLVYALAYKVHRHLHGNIYGLSAETSGAGASVTVFHTLPPDLDLESAREIIEQRF